MGDGGQAGGDMDWETPHPAQPERRRHSSFTKAKLNAILYKATIMTTFVGANAESRTAAPVTSSGDPQDH